MTYDPLHNLRSVLDTALRNNQGSAVRAVRSELARGTWRWSSDADRAAILADTAAPQRAALARLLEDRRTNARRGGAA